jgi:Rod binding domain-containing protein
MDAAALLAGRPVAAGLGDRSSSSVAARDAKLDPKLVAAAHAFEASLMQELLKPLRGGGAFGDESGDADDEGGGGLGGLGSSAEGSAGALGSFGTEALASALSEKGGLGIARRILDHFEAGAAAAERGEAAILAGGSAAGSPGGSWDRRLKVQDGTKIVTKVMGDPADKLKEGEPR